MQHFLASRQGQDIPIKHLYVEYRHWLEREKPFPDVTTELATLARQGDDFRHIVSPEPSDITWRICTFLETFDIRTVYPLLLAMMDAGLDDKEWIEISSILESYLLRRAVCNLTTKNYNRVFLSLTRNLKKEGFGAAHLKHHLLTQTGDSTVWPDDVAFREAWLHRSQYGVLNNPKLVHLFTALNQKFMSSKSEKIVFEKQPSVEHIMPQEWIANWPLPDGSKGMSFVELISAPESDPRSKASRIRSSATQTLGNLTILTSELNAAQSNLAWAKKRPEMMKHSLLPINQTLLERDTWDETSILERGTNLFQKAITLWPR
jgi:hypothetical protein